MAIVTRRCTFSVVGRFVLYVDVTFDDALLVIIDEYDVDITNCDLVSVRVIGQSGSCIIFIRRGNSQVWQSRTVTQGTDVTFSAGGPVRKVGDLVSYTVGGVT